MTKRIEPSKIMKGIKFYMVEDLAKILQVTPWTVRSYLRQGRIASVRVGQRIWVSEKDLSDFLMCKGIRDLPDKEFIKMINKAVEIRYEQWKDEAIPLMQKTVKAFLLEQKIKGDLKKISQNNVKLTEFHDDDSPVMQKRYKKTEKVKKDFEEAKKI
ncbi:hypothetical protein ES705_09398 [subsurface metagenome]